MLGAFLGWFDEEITTGGLLDEQIGLALKTDALRVVERMRCVGWETKN